MKLFQRISIERFNQISVLFATLWLLITIPLGIVIRPTIPDFEQFYIGGVIASRGEWDALYPIPKPRSLDNPGLRIHSDAKPKWKSLSKDLGTRDHTHFMLPPPSALLFAPLAFFSYQEAFWFWTFFETACVWGVAILGARLLRYVFGRLSRWEGVLILLIAVSPMTARAIRIANVSPPIALALAVALLAALRGDQPARGAWALLLGATFKYATLVLAPLLLAMRRWRMFIYLSVFGLLAVAMTVAFAGLAPFVEFYQTILPTLSRPSMFRGNQSLPGFLARVFGRPLTPVISIALNFARLFSLLMILWVMFKISPRQWRRPVNVLAGAGLLVSWLLVFSPIAWEHWPIFLCPVWGWLLWEVSQPGWRRVAALASLTLMCLPSGIFHVKGFASYRFSLPEPLNSSQLIGVILVLVLAYGRLLKPHLSETRETAPL